jgi:hypothetical protein
MEDDFKKVNVVEMIQRTIRLKDDTRQRITICKVGILNQKEDLTSSRERWKQNLKMNEGEILRETNFKELGITNKDGRDAYVLEKQAELRQNMKDEIVDLEIALENSQKREMELKDEYVYYRDRLEMLMKIYDIEGDTDLKGDILIERERVKISQEKI